MTKKVFNTNVKLGALSVSSLAVLCVSMISTSTAHADDHEDEGPHGAMFTVGLDAGRLGCSYDDGDNDCDGDGPIQAGTIHGQAGFRVSRGLAILGQVSASAHKDDDVTVSQVILGATARLYPARGIWLEGGVGVARARAEFDGGLFDVGAETDTAPAVMAGLGIELVSTDSLGLDIHVRGGTGFYDGDVNIYNIGVGVGLSFF